MGKKRKIKVKKKSVSRRRARLKLDFISMKTLEGLSLDRKIDNILKKVKEDHIVVLDEALDPDEEAKLVTATMEGISPTFKGIEFCTLPKKNHPLFAYIIKFAEGVVGTTFPKPGLTLVGPSTIIREIKRHPDAFYVSAEL